MLLSVKEREKQEQIIILDETRQKCKVQQIVVHNVFWAVWIGVLPTPIIDAIFMKAVQLKMISELSLEYNVRFSKNRGKAIITGLIAGLGTGVLAGTHLMKAIPGIGTIPGAINLTIFAGATTYAIGQIFIKHFESGGTLLDFDATQFKDYFREQMQEGEKVARRTQATPSS